METYRKTETILPLQSRRKTESGVILITVLIFLLAILALVLPLALMTRTAEKESARRLDNSVARMYANMALNHAKQRLRLGIYENEYKYHYGEPTTSPTPTPSFIANLSPYDTPFFDGSAEVFFDRKELMSIADNAPTSNGDIPTLGIKVEDEQGKLNINSLTPDILLGLCLETQSIDPKKLSKTKLKELLLFRDSVIKKMALKRVSSGTHYNPVANVSDLLNIHNINGSEYFGFNETQFESMARFLTAHSWRLYSKGFPDTYSSSFRITNHGNPEKKTQKVKHNRLLRLCFFDRNNAPISYQYLYPKKIGRYWYISFVAPGNALRGAYCVEDFHQININSCSPELLTALIMSKINYEDIKWSLEEAREITKFILPRLKAMSITKSGGKYQVLLAKNCEYKYLPRSGCYSIAGRYVIATCEKNILTLLSEDVGKELAKHSFPMQCSMIFDNIGSVHGRIQNYNSNYTLQTAAFEIFNHLRFGFSTTKPTRFFTTVSFDIYKITSSCRVSTPHGLTSSTWQIAEIVELGKGEALSSSPLRIGTLRDFYRFEEKINYNSLFRNPYRKLRITENGKSSEAFSTLNTFPLTDYYTEVENSSPCHVLSFSYCRNLPISGHKELTFPQGRSTGSFDVFNPNFLSDENFITSRFSCEGAGISTFNSRITLPPRTNPIGKTKCEYISETPSNYHCCGNYGISIWVMAKDWEPATESGRKHIFTMRPTDSANVDGATTLFVENGHLILYIEDDIGNWGQLDYPLTTDIFPKDTWMHIAAHIQGNKEGQMALLIDGRLANANYTSSHDRGYCLKSATSISRTKPKLALEATATDTSISVDSTGDFPNTGYLRIDDEIVFYASKTDATFEGLERGIGTSKNEKHSISTEITHAIQLSTKPFDSETPQKNDEIEIVSFPYIDTISKPNSKKPISEVIYTRATETEKFPLDMDMIVDISRNAWIVPFPRSFTFTATTTLHQLSYLMYGTTGTSTSGDSRSIISSSSAQKKIVQGDIDLTFLSPSDTEAGFQGFVQSAVYHKSEHVCFQLSEDLDDDATTLDKSGISFSFSEGRSSLVKMGSEVIGLRLAKGKFILTRGMLGTTSEEHSAGDWAIPITMLKVNPLPIDLTATAKKLDISKSFRLNSSSFGHVLRIGDEIIFIKFTGSEAGTASSRYSYHYELIRGFLGSTASSHSQGELIIPLPIYNYAAYDFADKSQVTDDYLEFFIHRAGVRYHRLAWKTQKQNRYIKTHAWFSTEQGGSFNPIQNSKNMFVFDDDSTNFEISRSGANQYVMSDEATIRIAYEYKKGAWDPNNLTRHGWKSLPYLDTIEIWCESADVVYYHSECP